MERRLSITAGRYLLIVSLSIIGLLAAACADDTPAADEDTDPGDPQPDAEEDTSEDEGDPGEIEITGETPEEIYQQLAEYPREIRDEYIYERALEEGRLTIYTATAQEAMELKTEGFMAAYPGVEADFVRLETRDVVERVRLEHQAGQPLVDVITLTSVEARLLHEAGLMANLYAVPIPEGYPELAYGDWYAAGDFNPSVVAWNTDLVSEDEVPTSYDDLLDPRWRGRLGFRDFPETTLIAMLETRGDEATEEWLKQIMEEQDPQVRVGSATGLTLLAAGEYAIHQELLISSIARIEADDPPIAWASLDPFPSGMSPNHIYVDAPNPFAAMLYMQYLLSPEGQQDDAENLRTVFNPDVPLAFEHHEVLRDAVFRGDMFMVNADMVAKHLERASELVDQYVTPRIHPDDR